MVEGRMNIDWSEVRCDAKLSDAPREGKSRYRVVFRRRIIEEFTVEVEITSEGHTEDEVIHIAHGKCAVEHNWWYGVSIGQKYLESIEKTYGK
jgi:hypothetical protein